MRLLASTTQRIAAAVAIAAAGVLLPAAALAAPALSGSPATSATAAPVPVCHGPRHQVWLGLGEGAEGMNQTFVPIEFSNLSPQACQLTGSPTVAVFSGHGQVGKAAATRASHRFVVLLSGETAHVILHIEFPSPLGPRCNPKMGELHITLGGMSTDLLGYPVAQCRNTKLNLLTVDPIHSGVGVPAFTLH